MKILISLSGGLDSCTVLGMAIAKAGKENVETVSVNFGQKQIREIECAKTIADYYGVKNTVFKLDLRQIGGSAQTDDSIEVPKDRGLHKMTIEIPKTWTPQRNTLFFTMLHAFAEVHNFDEVWVGVNQIDFSGYPDTRESFIKRLQEALNWGSKAFTENGKEIKIIAPLQHMNKSAIIKEGIKLNVPYNLTQSCYEPVENKSCGHCDSCILRLNGFKEAGIQDPIEYV